MHGPDWESARGIAYEAGTALRDAAGPAEDLALDAAIGRVLARDVASLHTMPHYASSAMDGWAVAGAGPWLLEPPATAAGRRRPHATAGTDPAPLRDGRARPIVTGESVPPGTTAVVRQEHGLAGDRAAGAFAPGDTLATGRPPAPGADIRPAGTEATAGATLLRAGIRLNPGHIAVAAVGGHDTLPAAPEIPVHLVLTGNEVVTSGIPGPGQVRDTFGPVLPACIDALGGTFTSAARIGDDRRETIDALQSPEALAAKVIVSTGGTGGSPADHLRPAAAELGGVPVIDSVAMRPGHPVMLTRLPDGRLLLSLPGNPLAALMAVVTGLEPLLRAAAGRPPSYPAQALAGEDVAGTGHSHRLLPAQWSNPVGRRVLLPSEHTGSAMMRGLATADVVLIAPPGGLRAGGPATYLPLPWYGL